MLELPDERRAVSVARADDVIDLVGDDALGVYEAGVLEVIENEPAFDEMFKSVALSFERLDLELLRFVAVGAQQAVPGRSRRPIDLLDGDNGIVGNGGDAGEADRLRVSGGRGCKNPEEDRSASFHFDSGGIVGSSRPRVKGSARHGWARDSFSITNRHK